MNPEEERETHGADETPPPPPDAFALEREKAAALRRVYEDDPYRDRDLEPFEARALGVDAPATPAVEPPPPPPRDLPRHPQGPRRDRGRDRQRGRGRDRGRPVRPPDRGPGPRPPGPRPPGPPPGPPQAWAQERDRMRAALSHAEGRAAALQREVETLRARLRSLASPGPTPGAAVPGGVTSAPAPGPGVLADQRLAILLDVPALAAAARRRGRSLAFPRIVGGLVRGRRLVRAIAYGATEDESIRWLQALGFEIAGEGPATASRDLETLAPRVDALLAVGFEDGLAPALEAIRDRGVRVEFAAYEPHDAPACVRSAHAFVRIGSEAG